MRQVRVTNFELLRILDGHEVPFTDTEGVPVLIRLHNPEELIESQRKAIEGLRAEGHDGITVMSRGQAANLCRPLCIDDVVSRSTRRELRNDQSLLDVTDR
jgi:hypothetical protein